MAEYVCCIDLGTSHIKVALLDASGHIGALSSLSAPATSADEAFGGLDAEAHFGAVCQGIQELLQSSRIRPEAVSAISLANQRATIVALGSEGRPLRSLSWQDARCGATIDEFVRRFGTQRFRGITGLPSSFLWSLGKILWLKETDADLFGSVSRFVPLHDYVLRRLGATEWLTDYSNASLTGLLDTRKLVWSEEILSAAGIGESHLPRLVPASSQAGVLSDAVAQATGLRAGTPLIVGGGDQQCATLGMGVMQIGDAGLCLGTAAVLSCPADRPVLEASTGLLCTVHVMPGRWVIEGFHNSFGSALRWMYELLGLSPQEDLDKLAARASEDSRVVFLPFLAGIGSPDFDAAARGGIMGLDLSHRPADLARAALEGVCMEVRRIAEAMARHVPMHRLIVAGGGSASPLLIRTLRQCTGLPLRVCRGKEATLLGAALLAWTGVGRFASLAEAVRHCGAESESPPPSVAPDPRMEALYREYCRCVTAVQHGGHRPANPG